jgi:hypothetical protein
MYNLNINIIQKKHFSENKLLGGEKCEKGNRRSCDPNNWRHSQS